VLADELRELCTSFHVFNTLLGSVEICGGLGQQLTALRIEGERGARISGGDGIGVQPELLRKAMLSFQSLNSLELARVTTTHVYMLNERGCLDPRSCPSLDYLSCELGDLPFFLGLTSIRTLHVTTYLDPPGETLINQLFVGAINDGIFRSAPTRVLSV
jgi:hypothetical protein